MDFLQRKFHYFFNIQRKDEKNREISRFEGYLQLIYKILSWEDISLTLSVFLLLNFFFWIVVHWELKLLGVIFVCFSIGFVGDAYLELPDQYSETLENLHGDITEMILSLKDLRRDSPFTFFTGMTAFFLWLSFIGRHMNGYLIFYFFMLGVFFLPLGISKLPPSYIAYIKKIIGAVRSERGVLAEDELIPFISDKNFSDRDPELDSLLTDKTADSITNSLISGITSMPSYLDAEEHEMFLEEEDLFPQQSIQTAGISFTPGELSSDSDSDPKDIRFDPAHFNGDSSSSSEGEENNYTKNMKFPDPDPAVSTAVAIVDTSSSKEQIEKLVSNILNVASVSGNLMANVIKSAISNPIERKSSSSDSEFEIINSEEAEEQ